MPKETVFHRVRIPKAGGEMPVGLETANIAPQKGGPFSEALGVALELAYVSALAGNVLDPAAFRVGPILGFGNFPNAVLHLVKIHEALEPQTPVEFPGGFGFIQGVAVKRAAHGWFSGS